MLGALSTKFGGRVVVGLTLYKVHFAPKCTFVDKTHFDADARCLAYKVLGQSRAVVDLTRLRHSCRREVPGLTSGEERGRRRGEEKGDHQSSFEIRREKKGRKREISDFQLSFEDQRCRVWGGIQQVREIHGKGFCLHHSHIINNSRIFFFLKY